MIQVGRGTDYPCCYLMLFFFYYFDHSTVVQYSRPSNKIFVANSVYPAFLVRPSIYRGKKSPKLKIRDRITKSRRHNYVCKVSENILPKQFKGTRKQTMLYCCFTSMVNI